MKKRRFRLGGIGLRVFLYNFGIIAVLMILVASVISVIMNNHLKEIIVEKYQTNGTALELNIQERLEAMERQTEEFIYNLYIQRSLEPGPLSAIEEVQVHRMWYRFSSAAVQNGVFIDYSGNIYQKVGKLNEGTTFDQTAFWDSSLAEFLNRSYAKPQWVFSRDDIFGTGEESLFLLRNVRHINAPNRRGVIILQLKDSYFASAFNTASTSPMVDYILLDPQDQVYYTHSAVDRRLRRADAEEITDAVEETKKTVSPVIEMGNRILFVNEEMTSGIKLVSAVPNTVIYQITETVQRSLIIITLIFAAIAAAAAMIYSFYFTRPIREIYYTMERFDGNDFSSRIHINTGTELDTIGQAYNSMVLRMDRMVQDISLKEKVLKEHELDSLLYQINPHFLYNTLDNMHMLARLDGNHTMTKLIHALTSMLRISLNKGDDMLTVSQELDHAKAYMDIQKIRYEGLFEYTVSCTDDAGGCKIMKLLLQPIVENSIKYGFAGLETGGQIHISVVRESGCIRFVVENNGASIAPQKAGLLNRIKEMDEASIRASVFTESGGFGIYNIVSRLKIKYGEAFDIHYSLTKTGGTRCVVQIPVE